MTKVKYRGGYRKQAHPQSKEDGQGWEYADKADTLNSFDFTDARTPILIVEVSDE